MRKAFLFISAAFCMLSAISCGSSAKLSKSMLMADQQSLVTALDNNTVKVEITRSVPNTSTESVVNYAGQGYYVSIRGDRATVYIPGLRYSNSATFGNVSSEAEGPTELVEMPCTLKSSKKGTNVYSMRSTYGIKWDITVTASANGTGLVKVVRDNYYVKKFDANVTPFND